MKVMVTGAEGQLGSDMMYLLHMHNVEALGVDRGDFDITDGEKVMAAVMEFKPDVIIHCAAYTDVDSAETEVRLCALVNGVGTENVANAAKAAGAKLVYISTDYVFSGEGSQPFQVDEPYNPKNVYGLTKMQGEKYIMDTMRRFFIIRSSWMFGLHGDNFVTSILKQASEKKEIRVVNDQIGSPTYSSDLARLIYEMISTDRYGVYHATNEGFCSWYEYACTIVEMAGLRCSVKPVSSSEYAVEARRPYNSRLSKDSLDMAGFMRLPDWHDALAKYMLELQEIGE